MLLRLASSVGLVCSLTLAACTGADDKGACAGSYLYRDADGDGFGDPAATLDGCAARAGYVSDDSDCDDADAAAYPGADERCDGADDDCDGTIDEDALDQTPIYADADGDGFGDPGAVTYVCDVPADAIVDGSDCDDADPDISPAADETCDGVDQDCDGAIDDDAIDPVTWHADADGDGFGDAGATTLACEVPDGFVADATDCDDTYAEAFPGADENCDGHDEDCDGEIDEGATDPGTWYPDRDGDGFGDAVDSTFACTPPEGWVRHAEDCDDASAVVFPGAEERCDGVDGDCDGAVDEDAVDPLTWHADRDGDGFGDPDAPSTACDAPPDHVADATDCDDGAADVFPGAPERCDGADEDCDGAVDDDPTDAPTWYADADRDGYGDPDAAVAACDAPADHLADASDCDDTSADVSPDVSEAAGNGVDDDCDGAIDALGVTDARLTVVGPSSGSEAGAVLALPGDLDGDGVGDLLVGSSCGRYAWMVGGDRDGRVALGGADATLVGADTCDGLAFGGAGDADGDGVADVLAGAWGDDGGGADAGAVFLLHGGALDGTVALTAGVTWTGAVSDHAGASVDFVGDLDGDGADDLAVGAPGAAAGRLYLTSGASGGALDAGTVYAGETDGDEAGAAVARAGDFDGDGTPDVAVGAPGALGGNGLVYVLAGAPGGAALSLSTAEVRVAGLPGGIGARIAGGADVDGDGYDDLVLGAPDASGGGRAWIVPGPGTATMDVGTLADSFRGAAGGDALGSAVALGDVDGDGHADVLLGASGAAYLYLAPAGALGTADADLTWTGATAGFGAAATAGDLDGDGLDDVLLSAWDADDGGTDAGAAYLFAGPGR